MGRHYPKKPFSSRKLPWPLASIRTCAPTDPGAKCSNQSRVTSQSHSQPQSRYLANSVHAKHAVHNLHAVQGHEALRTRLQEEEANVAQLKGQVQEGQAAAAKLQRSITDLEEQVRHKQSYHQSPSTLNHEEPDVSDNTCSSFTKYLAAVSPWLKCHFGIIMAEGVLSLCCLKSCDFMMK